MFHRELEELWDQQGGRCAYTNQLLTPGLSATLDHKFPSKRFPDLDRNLDNLEWVDRYVNMMKNNKTKEEFLAIVHAIANRTTQPDDSRGKP